MTDARIDPINFEISPMLYSLGEITGKKAGIGRSMSLS